MAAHDPVGTGAVPAAAARTGGSATLLGFRRTAILEVAVFVTLISGADQLFFRGDGFWHVAPHPFWLVVLLLSVQYGTAEGLLAAGVCSLALLLGHAPERTVTQDLYDYLLGLAVRPLLWFTAAVVFGELRTRQIRERDELRAQLDVATERTRTIAAAYERLEDVKRQLEVRVAGQIRTVVSMYEAAKAVETMEPGRVLTGALDNVRAVLNPRKCSMYVITGDQLEAGIQNGWGRKDRYLRRFRPDSRLFQEVVGRGRVLCVAEPGDEAVLGTEGMLAGPVLNPDTGEVRGMIKIEDMGFLDLNLSTIELFRALCDWVGAFYANAQRYRRSQRERAFDSRTGLYSPVLHARYAEHIHALARRAGFPVTAITARVEEPFRLTTAQLDEVARSFGAAVRGVLRETEVAFESGDSGWEFAVVLPLLGPADAMTVAGRLSKAFDETLPASLAGTRLTVEITPLEGTPEAAP